MADPRSTEEMLSSYADRRDREARVERLRSILEPHHKRLEAVRNQGESICNDISRLQQELDRINRQLDALHKSHHALGTQFVAHHDELIAAIIQEIE